MKTVTTLIGCLAFLSASAFASASLAAPKTLTHLSPGALSDALSGFHDCDGYCSLTPGSLEYAEAKAAQCDTPTSWAEQVAPGLWIAVCGDQEGGDNAVSCEDAAALHWHMSGGRDSEYENVLENCNAERPYFSGAR
jgi:hypothetical protein